MFNYTIIIPHKNTPDLLQRCIDSIPVRDDVQVIIVDDNSDKEMVSFKDFPGVERKNVEIIYSKGEAGKGPGYARNVGLSKAQGEWIIFADSDDYFPESFSDILNKYKNAAEDVIFFKCFRQHENGNVSDYPLINDAMDEGLIKGNTDAIVYGVPCPWGKLMKRSFLQKNSIKFQQITGGDDILFSIRMAVCLKQFKLSDDHLYCVVDRAGSLTRNTRWESFYSYSKACCDVYELLLPVSKQKLAINWLSAWWGFLWNVNKFRALSLVPYIFGKMKPKDAVVALKKGLKRGGWNWQNQ
jgi:glycosyltransferase involved in cell wall biosynthesis